VEVRLALRQTKAGQSTLMVFKHRTGVQSGSEKKSVNEMGGTQPFGTKSRSLGKQCKNFLNKPQIPSYMT